MPGTDGERRNNYHASAFQAWMGMDGQGRIDIAGVGDQGPGRNLAIPIANQGVGVASIRIGHLLHTKYGLSVFPCARRSAVSLFGCLGLLFHCSLHRF